MQIDDFIGQEDIISILKNKLMKEKIGHALLFSGPKGQGKKTLAILFAKAVLCFCKPGADRLCGECKSCKKIDKSIHPDISFIEPQGKSIKIDQIRELKKKLNFKPSEGRKKIFIFKDIQTISNEAANSLLNVLEEPPDYVLSILLTTNCSMLLPTILSRCEVYKFSPIPPIDMYEFLRENINYSDNDIHKAVAISGGYLEKARNYLEGELYKSQETELESLLKNLTDNDNRRNLFEYASTLASKEEEELNTFFEIFNLYLRDLYIFKITGREDFLFGFYNVQPFSDYFTPDKIEKTIKRIEKARKYIHSNVNRVLAFEGMLLEIKEVIENE